MFWCFKRILTSISLILSCFIPLSYAKTVTLSAMDWPPFYGKSLPENGFIAALTREAFLRSGYTLELTFMPWKRALSSAQSGLIDGVLGLYYSPEREKTLSFSESIYISEQVFIKKRDSTTQAHFNDFKNFQIAAQLGTLQADDLEGEGLNLYPTNNNLVSLTMLAKERVDLALMAREYLLFIQNSEIDPSYSAERIEIMSPPFRTYEIYNGFSRKFSRYEEITQAFNQGLLAMKQDGTYDAILVRFGLSSPATSN
ncbi:substrate-binding periplasmic protein [Vibrio ziniensis]|uniref:Transporter substrate-binding domain-containing protein n=1 Tax=Vibrio ziniensis TaxID=2711221 RepID=A0A6G7CJL4_9VIBR|nr:transporter substrate-binding domain-containing protein [Vibrio ziniensis]QIH42260.1 transporter substrate-binding domain-containing protein [Vibrio ziniensis]